MIKYFNEIVNLQQVVVYLFPRHRFRLPGNIKGISLKKCKIKAMWYSLVDDNNISVHTYKATWTRVNQSERYLRTKDYDLFLKLTNNIEEYE